MESESYISKGPVRAVHIYMNKVIMPVQKLKYYKTSLLFFSLHFYVLNWRTAPCNFKDITKV